MRRDTIFRIASIAKPITAAAAMVLVEACILRLDDPVDEFLPAVKTASASDVFPGIWDNTGWGLGVAINTRRDNIWETLGRYGWDGGYGTSWHVDPAEDLTGIVLTQRVWDEPGYPRTMRDFWTSTCQAIED